jgi:Fe-S cluster biogenesis protein NfuA
VEIRIKGALDKYVKPAVEMDGGNISFVKFEDGKLTLQLQGSCSGCPSSTVTLKQGIEKLTKNASFQKYRKWLQRMSKMLNISQNLGI